MAGILLTNHAEDRSATRGMPPFVLRTIARRAAMTRMGDGYYKTGQYGTAVVRNGAVTTVLAPSMTHPADMDEYDLSALFPTR